MYKYKYHVNIKKGVLSVTLILHSKG